MICTRHIFNFPRTLQHKIATLLENGKRVEIIVGDKVANDFYIPPEQPFKMKEALPYLYESNLRRFCEKGETQIENGQLVVRLWRDGDNTYHLKGVWVELTVIFYLRAIILTLERGVWMQKMAY